jgi:hypothetical protein
MSYIMVYTTNKTAENRLQALRPVRGRQASNNNFVVMDISKKIKVLRNNGMVLAFLTSLLNKYPNEVYVWVAERMTLHEFPDDCKKAGNWLAEKSSGRNLRFIPNKEELIKCKINYSMNTKG